MVIKWSEFAIANLQDFLKYSNLYDPKVYVKGLVHSIYLLEQQPKMGKVLFEVNNVQTRQLIHKMHRIIYRIVENQIHIGAVLHVSQDLESSIRFVETFFK